MAKVNVAQITFRSGFGQDEEMRGYTTSQFAGGMVLFNWPDGPETVMYPVDTIRNIVVTQEEQE